MDRLNYYIEMEARYRKWADAEPASRDKHIADAEAWRHLADTAILVFAKQDEFAARLATYRLPRSR